jgi:arylsulfatase A-like enzyme
MLLSKMNQHRGSNAKGTWSNTEGRSQFKGKQKNIAEALKEGGNYDTMMAGKWHIGAKIPPNGVQDKERLFSSPLHDWSLQLIDGPQDIGFDYSYITAEGIQKAP